MFKEHKGKKILLKTGNKFLEELIVAQKAFKSNSKNKLMI